MLVTIQKFYSPDKKPLYHYDAPDGVELESGEFWMPKSLTIVDIKPKTSLPLPKRLIGREVYSRPDEKSRKLAGGLLSRSDVTYKFVGDNTEYTAAPHMKDWNGKMYDYLTLTPVSDQVSDSKPDIDFKPYAEMEESKIPTFEAFCEEWDKMMNS